MICELMVRGSDSVLQQIVKMTVAAKHKCVGNNREPTNYPVRIAKHSCGKGLPTHLIFVETWRIPNNETRRLGRYWRFSRACSRVLYEFSFTFNGSPAQAIKKIKIQCNTKINCKLHIYLANKTV